MSSHVNLDINPANVLSSGEISYVKGNPIIQFIIGASDRYLIGSTVRLAGDFATFTTAAQDTAIPDANQVQMSNKLGVYSVIDQLVIKSQKTHQTIEQIRHYNRFLSTYMPYTTSKQDCIGHLQETALILPSYEAQRDSVIGQATTNTNSFCINLPCGMFNGQNPIPLSSEAIGGLIVEVHLAPDSNVLFSSDGSSASAAAINSSNYQLSNVHLVAEAISPAPGPHNWGQAFEYNSISSFYSTLNSTNAVLNFNLGLSRVLGVFCNMLPAEYINNYGQDGMACLPLMNKNSASTTTANAVAKLNQVVFTKAGSRHPLLYNVDTMSKDQASNVLADPQVVRNVINSIMGYNEVNRINVNPNNNNNSSNNVGADFTDWYKMMPDGGSQYALGVAYDTISGDGENFSTDSWGLQLSCDLTTDFPNAIFVFVHAKQTLLFNGQGVQLIN